MTIIKLLLHLLFIQGLLSKEIQHFGDWGYWIDPDSNIANVSIPGTHFTGASAISPRSGSLFCTQSMTPAEQLEAGIRYFDLVANVGGDNYTLNIVRFNYFTPYTFDMIQSIATDFLNNHPYEFLIWRIVEETPNPYYEPFQTVLNKNIEKYSKYYFTKNNNTSPPFVRDLSKKILIIQDFLPRNSSYYYIGDLVIQENSTIPDCSADSLNNHLAALAANIQDSLQTNGNLWHLTDSDACVFSQDREAMQSCTSKTVATSINPALMTVLSEFPSTNGILSMSFPDQTIISTVIQNNQFQSRQEETWTWIPFVFVIGVLISVSSQIRFLLVISVVLEMIFSLLTLSYQTVRFRDFGTRFTSKMDWWIFWGYLMTRILSNFLFTMYSSRYCRERIISFCRAGATKVYNLYLYLFEEFSDERTTTEPRYGKFSQTRKEQESATEPRYGKFSQTRKEQESEMSPVAGDETEDDKQFPELIGLQQEPTRLLASRDEKYLGDEKYLDHWKVLNPTKGKTPDADCEHCQKIQYYELVKKQHQEGTETGLPKQPRQVSQMAWGLCLFIVAFFYATPFTDHVNSQATKNKQPITFLTLFFSLWIGTLTFFFSIIQIIRFSLFIQDQKVFAWFSLLVFMVCLASMVIMWQYLRLRLIDDSQLSKGLETPLVKKEATVISS